MTADERIAQLERELANLRAENEKLRADLNDVMRRAAYGAYCRRDHK